MTMIKESLWRAHSLPRFDGTVFPDIVDVVIVGGGITGLTAAYLLKRSGKRVAVFERERIGAGESGNTSAHLTYATDLRLPDLQKQFGRGGARLAWEGGAAAIDLMEMIATQRSIACGFRRVPGYTCSPFFSDTDVSAALKEDAALASEFGFDALFSEAGPITGKPAVRYGDNAIFHPLDYLLGLAIAIDGDGSFVFERAEVGEVLQDPLVVTVNGESVACSDVIIATHVPITGSSGLASAVLLQTKLYPHSSYVLGASLPADSLAPGLYSDESDPYYFLRVHDTTTGRYAIFGGEDHKTGQESDTQSSFDELAKALKVLVPEAKIERRWSGQVIETVDGLPYVGTTAEHQYISTGYSGNGLTFGTLGAMIIHDMIMEQPNPWTELFDPNRKASRPGTVKEYVAENKDYPYYMLRDWIARREGDVESVARGDGKVLKLDGRRVAVHRSTSGKLTKVSAICTHMGCLVRFNNAEQTWDCPCHGSRFTTDGLVLGGPAEVPLEQIND